MGNKENITEKDLDFYLTVIALFCEYNISEHYSDIMFKDITSDIIKRDSILYKLSEDGYITMKKSPNINHRFKINITDKGVYFQRNGGYTALNTKIQKENKINKLNKYKDKIIGGLIGAIISGIATYITTILCR